MDSGSPRSIHVLGKNSIARLAFVATLAGAALCAPRARAQSYMMVPDEGGLRLMLFNASDGSIVDLNYIASGVNGAPTFHNPKSAIQVGNEIWLVDQTWAVANTHFAAIYRFAASNGTPAYIGSITNPNITNITDIAVVGSNVWIVDIDTNSYRVFDTSGNLLATYPSGPTNVCPYNVSALNSTTVLAPQTCSPDQIFAIDPATGANLGVFIDFTSRANGPIRQINLDNTGAGGSPELWIAAWSGGVYRASTTGVQIANYNCADDGNNEIGVNGVAALDDGEVMFTSTGTIGIPGIVGKFTPPSASATTIVGGLGVFGGGGQTIRRLQIGAPGPTPPYIHGLATPNPANSDQAVLLSATVIPGTIPASTGLVATLDLSSIGGPSSVVLMDDPPGSGAFSYAYQLNLATPTGTYSLPLSVIDDQMRTGSSSISLSINGPTNPTVSAATFTSGPGLQVQLQQTVTPGVRPNSTDITLSADLSPFGLSTAEAFTNNPAGSNTYTYTLNIPAGQIIGNYNVPLAVSDAQSRSSSANMTLNIVPPTNPTIALSKAGGAAGASALLVANVVSGQYPDSSGYTVTADLSSFGLTSSETFTNTPAGSNTFTYTLAIPAGQALGAYNVTATVNDAQSRSNTNTSTLYVIAPAPGGFTIESEPNDSKAAATAVTLGNGQGLYGFTLGGDSTGAATSLDEYRVTVGPLSPGIYQQRLAITTSGAAGHTGTIRGLNQSAGVIGATDTVLQTTATSGALIRTNQWYDFGGGESFYYRITGTASTTASYSVTLTSTPVTPTVASTHFNPGSITISRSAGSVALDFLVFDTQGNGVGDFVNHGSTSSNTVSRAIPAGTYYLAVSTGGSTAVTTADNRAAPSSSPFRNNPVFDSGRAVLSSSSSATSTAFTVQVSDGTNTQSFALTRNAPYQVFWIQFQVGTPVVCCRGATCAVIDSSLCTSPPGNAGVSQAGGAVCNAGGSTSGPCCYPDYDKANGIQVADIFAFLNDWFAGSLFAHVGGDGASGTLAVQDIFNFLNAWFAGC
jgi:hypothetical protein